MAKRYDLTVQEIDDSNPDEPVLRTDREAFFQFDDTFEKQTVFEWLDELSLSHILKG